MYSRGYTEQKTGILIPESYGGIALRDSDKTNDEIKEAENEPANNEASEAAKVSDIDTAAEAGAFSKSGFFNGLPISKLFGGLGNLFPFSKGIGIEEILLAATAAFLLFSKDGDKECAIILLLLLFIS